LTDIFRGPPRPRIRWTDTLGCCALLVRPPWSLRPWLLSAARCSGQVSVSQSRSLACDHWLLWPLARAVARRSASRSSFECVHTSGLVGAHFSGVTLRSRLMIEENGSYRPRRRALAARAATSPMPADAKSTVNSTNIAMPKLPRRMNVLPTDTATTSALPDAAKLQAASTRYPRTGCRPD